MSHKNFEDVNHVKIYSDTRPKVPKEVIDYIFNYLDQKIDPNNWKVAVDVGCGNGQCTNNLAKYFQNVYGFDISVAQIEEAKKLNTFDNIQYDISAAENLESIETNSVQLLTAAASVHWFDLNRFFVEVDRVLAPKGVVALICYKLYKPIDPKNPNDDRITKLIRDTFYDQKLTQYFEQNIRDLWEKDYRSISFPKDYDYEYRDNFIASSMGSAQLAFDRIKSSSMYQKLLENNKIECEEITTNAENKLRAILGVHDLSQYELLINVEYYVAMGRKK